MVPAANADVVAVIEHRVPSRGDNDIVRINAGTGSASPVPFDTTADEIHPSVSSDGTRIAFERYDPTDGSERMLVNDLHSGQTTTVLDASATASADALDPSISSDGQTLLMGGPFQQFGTSIYFARVGLFSLASMPNGPFAQSTFQPQFSFPGPGSVGSPVQNGSTLAFDTTGPGTTPGIVVGQVGGSAGPPLESATVNYSDPTLGSPGGVPTVLFEQSSSQGVALGTRPASPLSSFAGPPARVPGINFTDGLDPAFTSDGRYIGFLRTLSSQPDWFLFVWDTQTQTLLNPAGVDIGDPRVPTLIPGDLFTESFGPYLYEINVFHGPGGVTAVGTVHFDLVSGSAVGILVQRIVGHHRLFGRTVPTLRVVGHVPLGTFRPGRHHLRWDLKVNGRRLRRGTYQVTLRSLSASQKIRDFAVPRVIHVR
jgi:hypothetical protein